MWAIALTYTTLKVGAGWLNIIPMFLGYSSLGSFVILMYFSYVHYIPLVLKKCASHVPAYLLS